MKRDARRAAPDAQWDAVDRCLTETFALSDPVLEAEPALSATTLQIVGSKGYDGLAIVLVLPEG